MNFEYGETEIAHLKKRDKKFAAAIDKVGIIQRDVRTDPLEALVMSVISQQISGKAARSIAAKLYEKVSPLTHLKIIETSIEEIQKCGMSFRKAGYIKGLAEAVESGELNFSQFDAMPDEEIIKKLSSLNGIGVWTAEMFLIFCLRRPDVVSWGDLAIRRGLMNIYGQGDITKEQFQKYREKFSPYGSIASLYIWAMS